MMSEAQKTSHPIGCKVFSLTRPASCQTYSFHPYRAIGRVSLWLHESNHGQNEVGYQRPHHFGGLSTMRERSSVTCCCSSRSRKVTVSSMIHSSPLCLIRTTPTEVGHQRQINPQPRGVLTMRGDACNFSCCNTSRKRAWAIECER